jgi:serine/threonine-protein kinase
MTVAANVVIASTPSSGTLLPGQTVTLNVSSGKPKVPVPPIALGTEPYSQASAALTQAGFIGQETLQYSDTVPKNAVISVSPPSGTEVVIGSPIAVVVSQGPHMVTVPTTKGESVGAASQLLSSVGLNPTAVEGNPVNTVKNTNPAAGTRALYGSSVTIITS